MNRRGLASCSALALLLVAFPASAQQDLGHKILGVLGIDAAVQRDAGLPFPAIRTRIASRYAHDLAVRSRPQGGVLSLELSFVVWRPREDRPLSPSPHHDLEEALQDLP